MTSKSSLDLKSDCKCHNKGRKGKYVVTSTQITDLSPFKCPPSSETEDSIVIKNAEVEPSIAVGPNPKCPDGDPIIVVGYQQDRYSRGGGCSANYIKISTDNGKSFGSPIPVPTVLCFDGKFERDTDPRVAVTGNGSIYAAGIPFDYLRSGLGDVYTVKYDLKSKSFDKINYLDLEDLSVEPFPTTDYEFIISDPQDKCGRTVYITWIYDFYPGDRFLSKIKFSKTTNGRKWSTPTIAVDTPPENIIVENGGDISAQGMSLGLLKNPGKNYSKIIGVYPLVIGANTQDIPLNPFYSTYSLDQGKTWSTAIQLGDQSTTVNGQTVDPDNYEQLIRSGDTTTDISTDRKRNIIYAVTQEDSLVRNNKPSAVYLYVSTDGADSWKKFGPVNTDNSTQAFNPAVSVLKGGKIAITYYDFRMYKGSKFEDPLLTDRWMDVYKFDGESVSLKKEIRLTDTSFNMRNAPSLNSAGSISPSGKFLGDYVQQANKGRTLYCVYPVVPSKSENNPSNIQLSIIKY